MIPVMKPDNPEQPLIWAGGRAHSRAEVLSAATALAERLPERSHVLNACGTRYGFMVGLLAALLRGQVTVLPGDRSDRAVALLAERYRGLYRLADEAGPGGRLETLDVAPDAPSAPGTPALPEIPAQRVVAIVFTSGSTGEPMPNEKPMGLLETTGRLIARRMGFDQGASAAILTTVPPQHMYGLETSISVPLWAGASAHSLRPLYPADIASALADLPEPRVLVTTPVHLKALLATDVALPKIHTIISATAPLPREMAEEAEQRFGTRLVEIFGFSEAGTIATRRTVEGPRWRTCDGLVVKAAGERCLVNAPHFPEPVPMTDQVEVIAPDTFVLHGRLSDNLKIAGKRTSLSGLNTVLNGIEGVEDATFYLADEADGSKVDRLVAFVVAPGRQRAEIEGALRGLIDPTFMPRRLFLVPALPRAETGKLTRGAMAALLAQMTGG